ncbi:MAG TPA: DUF4331 family protein [Kofleriaceae bacterium]|jgi:hypothetical protein|nr:DUF4331 family protein [Kofleriaceae bacterium]
MTIRTHLFRGATALALVVTAACSSSSSSPGPDAGTGGMGSGSGTPPTTVGFHQVEQLARPGINEALLITEAFNAGYNATAPSFTGVPADTLDAVVDQAKTVLQALYLGACLINGVAGLTPDTGVKPAAIKCHAVGAAIWMADSVTLTPASKTAAAAYADKVFGQFIPDVMRVDTSVDSSYLVPCGDLSSTPLLCGGRFLSDDVIDVTYDYLLNGAANYLTPGDGGALDQQVLALVSDGVAFSKDPTKNALSLSKPDAANEQQGHPDVSTSFPYSAPPF